MDTVRLILGDALTELAKLPTASVDAVITDPPYGTNKVEWDHSIDKAIFSECLRVSRGYCLFFYANTRLYHILGCLNELGADTWTMVWSKPNSMQIARKFLPKWSPIVCAYRNNVPFWGKDLHMVAVVPQNNGHPTPKMPEIVEWLVLKATQPGGIVLDPFMGSGTAGVVCKTTGRHFIGVEINETYFRIAERRIAETHFQPSLLPNHGFHLTAAPVGLWDAEPESGAAAGEPNR